MHHGALNILKHIATSVLDFKVEHNDVYKGYVLGKYNKTMCPSSDNMAARVLDLIHLDVCGPMSSVSLKGYEYYVTFIDDYSRKTWIFFMKTKDQVFNRF